MADYINNKEFGIQLTEHRINWLKSKEDETEPPIVPDAIAATFLMLAKKLATRYNFSGYTWRDDMVSDAVISCLKSAHKFDINVSTQSFSYFSLLCWRAFTDLIKQEKEHAYVRAKMFYMIPEDSFDTQEQDDGEFGITQDFIPYFDVQEYERKDNEKRLNNKKKKTEVKEGLDLLLDDDEPPVTDGVMDNLIEEN